MNIYFVLVIGLIFYFVVPALVILFVKNKKISIAIISTLLALFLIVLFLGIYTNVSFVESKVFIKFNFSNNWFNKQINWNVFSVTKQDFIINIIMLIPVGIVCRFFTNNKTLGKRILTIILTAFACGVLTETGQYILPIYRSVQLSDCILNAISVLIGSLFASACFLVKRLKNNKK